ncbi:peroxisomal membrane protein PEX14 [Chrysoperla carnea]|uniref:peroxisomal membrane protein PEX14 n=1 Tax=Chrysoperla carnea TaxID=189513 RepID=UPI001D063870|nr:peroxisomal membrane protein PEX14 [Chrysoperla carnea]XP_044733124.1 peroxisomal membrane protein PEX14 [Chrysoperla carnea]
MSITNEQQLTEIKVNVDQVETTTTTMVDTSNNQNKQIIRNELVDVAVKFLKNPKVGETSLDQRKKFLKSKGLTDIEINEAINRSSTLTHVISSQPPPLPQPLNYVVHQQHGQISTFTKIKEILESLALFSGLMYGVYLLYKKYIYPYLFGKKPKPTTKEDENNKKLIDEMTQMKTTNNQIHETLQQIQSQLNDKIVSDKQIGDIKSEVSTIKSLLLSKKHFPSVPVMTSDSCVGVHPPSIPAWQLQSSAAVASTPDDAVESDKSEDIIEMGSGSNSAGSSETEVITKNSDSSTVYVYHK